MLMLMSKFVMEMYLLKNNKLLLKMNAMLVSRFTAFKKSCRQYLPPQGTIILLDQDKDKQK